jgi:probable rRNA maturation factor
MPAPDAVRSLYRPPWRIDLTVRPSVPHLFSANALAGLVAKALDVTGGPAPASIGVILADDAELADLNATHMGADGPTDVLSFPLLPSEAYPTHPGRPTGGPRAGVFPLPPGSRPHLGDIVVSVERAIEQATAGHGGQASDQRWAPADELRLLLVHGVLHVTGWDHADPGEEAAMRALEQRLLSL